MKFLVLKYSLLGIVTSFAPEYSPQDPILKYSKPIFLLCVRDHIL